MSAAVMPRVEIDERIRQQPELLAAVNEATAYLGEHIGTHAREVPPPAGIRWRFALLDDSSIELTMSDSPEFEGFIAQRVFPLRYMNDPVNRDIMTLRVWRDLLAERSRKNMARIDKLITEIDWERYAHDYGEALKNSDKRSGE